MHPHGCATASAEARFRQGIPRYWIVRRPRTDPGRDTSEGADRRLHPSRRVANRQVSLKHTRNWHLRPSATGFQTGPTD